MRLLVDTEALGYLLFVCFSALWLYWLWLRRHWYRFSFRFQTYFGLPMVGSVSKLRHPKDILTVLTKLFEECKQNTINVWMGMDLVMITKDPKIIEKVLSSSELLDKSENIYRPIYNALQGGIISSPAKEWYPHRKLINPSFSHKVILSFFPVFHKAKKDILSRFNDLIGTTEHKLSDMLRQTTLRITVETTMGKVVNPEDKIDENFVRVLYYGMESIQIQILLKYMKLQWLNYFNPRYHKAKKYGRNFVHELIINKLQQLDASAEVAHQQKVDVDEDKNGTILAIKKKPNIFIDEAIKIYQKNKFTLNDIISESNNIVVASFEAIASITLSTIVMLAMHPDVQEKLYEEIVSVFPEKDFEMEYEHMEQLPYFDMVINEVMRIEPPLPIIARQSTKATQLTEDILLPENLQIMISIFHLHRSTEIWGPNANRFDPDNFLPENLAEKHSNAFIPFSKGPRNCIGWRYGVFGIKVILAGCVRNYRYSTTFRFKDLEYIQNITLKYKTEPGIKIHRR